VTNSGPGQAAGRAGGSAADLAPDAGPDGTSPDVDPAAPDAGPDGTGPDVDPAARSTGPDVDSLPGGGRAALEAVLMVIDEPATAAELAAGLNLTVDVVEELLAELQREYNGYTVNAPDVHDASFNGFGATPRALNCGISPEAGGSIPALSSPISLADSCWRDRQPG
jgi:segregation and condensation protein B